MLWIPEPDAHGALRVPLVVEDFAAGTADLHYAAYAGAEDLPGALVASVRCVVLIGRQAVIVENGAGTAGVLPGGHIEGDETWEETATREVAEEVGIEVDPAALSRLGYLHVYRSRHPTEPGDASDSLQPVYLGRADNAPTEWVDLSHGRRRQVWLVGGSGVGALPVRPCHLAMVELALADGSGLSRPGWTST